MKIVVIGGSGLIGSKVVNKLRERGHDALAASPSSGVNTLTSEGLVTALTNAQVAVDVSNPPSFGDAEVMDFFTTSTRNLLAAEKDTGVEHHVALSIVGIERLPGSGYFRAKVAQERLIKDGPIPYSIVRATQFFEFIKSIADTSSNGDTVRLAPVSFQPIAAEDVAIAVWDVALERPVNGVVEVAGPEQFQFDELFRTVLGVWNDPRKVVSDPHARYFGAKLDERSLVPDGDSVHLSDTRLEDWLRGQPASTRIDVT